MDGMGADYEANPELDQYEAGTLDDQYYASMTAAERRKAEAAMADRDGLPAEPQGLPKRAAPLLAPEEDAQGMRVRRMGGGGPNMQYYEDADEAGVVNLEDFEGPLREWLMQPKVKLEVRRRFREFLCNFKGVDGKVKYTDLMSKMCNENSCTLEVCYADLSNEHPVLGLWVADAPRETLALFDAEVLRVVCHFYKGYDRMVPYIFVRISGLPILDQLRDLRQSHLNGFVQVKGTVTRRTSVFPQLDLVKWDCLSCGYVAGPFAVQWSSAKVNLNQYKPNQCPQCQKKVFRINSAETVYKNYQKITLCESPGTVPAGRIPRSRSVILQNDLCDSVRPGEQISVTGVYTNHFEAGLNVKSSFPVFSTVIEANYIAKDNDYFSHCNLTETDIENIQELSRDPNIEERIITSIAPSIYGHHYIKRAIAFALFGGHAKQGKNKHKIRGDINVLIMGDPGVGKSQFLKYTEKLAARAVYATGKGASAVGLTAAVRKDPLTREWTLEGGALVLADRGICLIDEFDKMNDQDRVSIHEAMEQQSISISKAGIVTSLQARCAVIAAANPIKGRYDSSLTFLENVDLTDPILSRFDVLAVVKDLVDPLHDEKLGLFVVGNHMRAHPRATEEERNMTNRLAEKSKLEIDQDLLRKYIVYAKQKCKPELSQINSDKVTQFYATLRQKSNVEGSIPIAVRHIESILRMSVARSKMHLRDQVNGEDVDCAIKVLLESFIETQKFSVKQQLTAEFKRYLTTATDSNTLLMHLLQKEVRSLQWYRDSGASTEGEALNDIEIDLKEFKNAAKALDIGNLNNFFKSTEFKASFTLDRKGGRIKKIMI